MTKSEHGSSMSESIFAAENIAIGTKGLLENKYSIDRQPQIGFDPERLVPAKTYVEIGIEKLTTLCSALGMTGKTAEVVEVFRAMTISWGDRKIGESAEWRSETSDDGSPFEFSIALDPNQVELRILIEAQGRDPNLQSNWQAGLELNQYLAKNHNVSLDRFEQIADLYVPTNADAKFSIWHSACFYPDKPSAFKLYLNPQSQQKSRSAAIVEESLVRLGFTHAWPTLAQTAAQRGPDKDEFVYFSLDLTDLPHARVKIYLRHHDATPAELESALSAARNHVPGDAIEFCQAMAAGQAAFSAKPAITAFAWVEEDNATPSSSTLHLPISNYATDDRAVSDLLDLYFVEHHLPVSQYQSAIRALAVRPLADGIGMHSYTSLRRERRQRRVTLYLNPEVNFIRSPGKVLATAAIPAVPSLEKLAWHYEEHSLAHHPFLQRMEREPVNPQSIWILLTNLRGAVNNFTRRLASIVARTDNEQIRCILAKQLNDELGNGNINGIHRKLFDRLMAAIEPWQVELLAPEMLHPGQEFSQQMENIYVEATPYIGVGAAVLMEIFGKQFDLWLGRELRKTNVERSAISWVILHEELELDHADESIIIARFVAEAQAEVEAIKGVNLACLASWKFLDGLYQLCYGMTATV